MTSVSKEIKEFIQSLPRTKNGFMILDYYYRDESDLYTLQLLNTIYMGKETITFEHLRDIPVSDSQEEKYNIEEKKLEYEINKYEKIVERR